MSETRRDPDPVRAPTACTYCSAEKRTDPTPLPAVERYQSPRITELAAAGELLILSGEFGLLAPGDPIPWYDHLLLPEEVARMVPRITAQLEARSIKSLEYHTADPAATPAIRPYLELIEQACELAGVKLGITLLDGARG